MKKRIAKLLALCLLCVSLASELYGAKSKNYIGDGNGLQESIICQSGEEVTYMGRIENDYQVCYYYTTANGIRPTKSSDYTWIKMERGNHKGNFFLTGKNSLPAEYRESLLREEKIRNNVTIKWHVSISEMIKEGENIIVYLEIVPEQMYTVIFDYNIKDEKYKRDDMVMYNYEGSRIICYKPDEDFGRHFIGWKLIKADGTEVFYEPRGSYIINKEDTQDYIIRMKGVWEEVSDKEEQSKEEEANDKEEQDTEEENIEEEENDREKQNIEKEVNDKEEQSTEEEVNNKEEQDIEEEVNNKEEQSTEEEVNNKEEQSTEEEVNNKEEQSTEEEVNEQEEQDTEEKVNEQEEQSTEEKVNEREEQNTEEKVGEKREQDTEKEVSDKEEQDKKNNDKQEEKIDKRQKNEGIDKENKHEQSTEKIGRAPVKKQVKEEYAQDKQPMISSYNKLGAENASKSKSGLSIGQVLMDNLLLFQLIPKEIFYQHLDKLKIVENSLVTTNDLTKAHMTAINSYQGIENANKYAVLYEEKEGKMQAVNWARIDDLGYLPLIDAEKYTVKIFSKGYIKLKIGEKVITINEANIESDVPAEIVNNEAMVPLRIVAEGLEANVWWNSKERSVVVSNGKNVLTLNIEEKDNNSTTDAILHKNRVLVPISYVSENLEMAVIWNEQTKSVEIFK